MYSFLMTDKRPKRESMRNDSLDYGTWLYLTRISCTWVTKIDEQQRLAREENVTFLPAIKETKLLQCGLYIHWFRPFSRGCGLLTTSRNCTPQISPWRWLAGTIGGFSVCLHTAQLLSAYYKSGELQHFNVTFYDRFMR